MLKMKNTLPGEDGARTAAGRETAGWSSWKMAVGAGAAVALAMLVAGLDTAGASTDTTFQGPLDTIEGIVGGTGGQLAAALAVGAALVGSVLRFNAMQLMGAVGVGVAAGAGVGIVTGLVGTAIV
ncbi:MAG: hypothetical protein OXN16_13420 [Gammaproteobacteria bacterium]|nr:hypothetical protein [Gammaproteobacteria bacterium]